MQGLVKPYIFLYDAYMFSVLPYELLADKKTVLFHYTMVTPAGETYEFTEKALFPIELTLDKPSVVRALNELSVGLSFNYFKLYLQEKVILSNESDIDFWTWAFRNGFTELVYKNKLDWSITDKISIEGRTVTEDKTAEAPFNSKKVLVGIGGGKDSTLVVELLKRSGFEPIGFVIETERENKLVSLNTTSLDIPLLVVHRKLDQKMFELNDLPTTYSGHYPVSLVFALIGAVLCAELSIATLGVGNEASADETNTLWLGREVNHQWSKTLPFEDKVREHVHRSVSKNILYVSLLRPFGSLRIAKNFNEYCRAHLKNFSSCNKNFIIKENVDNGNLWCGECAKCLGTFLIFAPWFSKVEMENIFGNDLLDKENLKSDFDGLIGLSPIKPFDCVATRDESQLALLYVIEDGLYSNSALIQSVPKEFVANIAKRKEQLEEIWLKTWHDHRIPAPIISEFKKLII